ncbi:YqaJ viral recombinase family protein [Laceyella putida]|uniref:YqaJ viral recombinase family protein n=1 Tax=Laceyella putida TaxID=110101 RepID=A0ABW2RR68_9BACL
MKKGLGCHDAIAILNLSSTRSRMEVYLNKTLGEKQEEKETLYDILKIPILQKFSEQFGYPVEIKDEVCTHPTIPYLIGNTLGTVMVNEKKGLIRLTLVDPGQLREWRNEGVPIAENLKMQHNLNCFGFSFGYIVMMIGNQKVDYRRIDRDEELIRILEKECQAFWEYIERREIPPMDGSKASERFLREHFSETIESEISLPSEALTLIEEYYQAKEAMNMHEEEVKRIQNQLKYWLGQNERGYVGRYGVTWKTVRTTRFDMNALERDHPELIEKYKKESTYRRFSIQK